MKVIETSEKVSFVEGFEYEVIVNYSNLENLKYYCKKNSINITKIEYTDEIKCILQIKKENVKMLI